MYFSDINRIGSNIRRLLPVSIIISDLCEISDLLLLVSYLTSQSEGIKFGDNFLMFAV